MQGVGVLGVGEWLLDLGMEMPRAPLATDTESPLPRVTEG